MENKGRIGVLISGRGSHLKNFIDSCAKGSIPAEIVLVISNQPEAPGLRFAMDAGIETAVLSHRQFQDRAVYDGKLVELLKNKSADLICLAGYMRLLSPTFIHAFPERIMNVHPSLLPSFPGLHAQRQALQHGVKITGCTVHFVDSELDSGPIIIQKSMNILENDTEESLSSRLLPIEHESYREAVALFFQRRLRITGRKVTILNQELK